MKKSAFVIIWVSSLLLFACESNVPDQKEVSISPDRVEEVFPADDSIPEDLIIRLQRTPCYGECPAYLMTVKADGKVSFFGQNHVEKMGQTEDKIGVDKIKQLIEEFKKADFFNLEDNYTSENCATDNPTVRTTLFINGKTKKIEHDTGCEAPKELTALEDKIDEIVGSEKWVGEKKAEK